MGKVSVLEVKLEVSGLLVLHPCRNIFHATEVMPYEYTALLESVVEFHYERDDWKNIIHFLCLCVFVTGFCNSWNIIYFSNLIEETENKSTTIFTA